MPMVESPIERWVKGLLFGEQFKGQRRQQRWEALRQDLLSEQIEDIRQGRKAKQQAMALIKDLPPEVQKAQALAEGVDMPWSTSLDVSGYVSPEQRAEKERTEMMGGLADIQAQPEGAYTLGKLFEEAPPGIKAKMIPLAKTFPGMIPETEKVYTGEEAWLREHPGATHEDYLRATKRIGREFEEPSSSEAKYQRFKDWYITQGPHFGLIPEEEIRKAFLQREFEEKAKVGFQANQDEIDYIDAKAESREEAEAWLRKRGYPEKEIDTIIENTKFRL